MLPITTDQLRALLREYVRNTGASVDLLLVGGLALQAYGLVERATQDIDGELIGDPEPLAQYLRGHQIPADLGENMSGWSVVAMSPGYRDRAAVFLEEPASALGCCPRPISSSPSSAEAPSWTWRMPSMSLGALVSLQLPFRMPPKRQLAPRPKTPRSSPSARSFSSFVDDWKTSDLLSNPLACSPG